MIIEIKMVERHDLKEEVIEHVARLLCRANGEDPDEDLRVSGNVMLTVHLEYPQNLKWIKYRPAAIEALQGMFGTS